MRLIEVPISKLMDNPKQTRFGYEIENEAILKEKNIEQLANSIEKDGLKQPIGICPSQIDPSKYAIVFGHRRVLAFIRLGRDKIPAVLVEEMNKDKLFKSNIIENLQRKDLSLIEEGMIYNELLKKGTKEEMSSREVAEELNVDVSRISRVLSITSKLKDSILERLRDPDAKKDVHFLYRLTKITDPILQEKIFNKFQDGKLDRESGMEEIKNILESIKKGIKPKEKIEDGVITKEDNQGLKIRGSAFKSLSAKSRFAIQARIRDLIKEYAEMEIKELEEIKKQ